MHLSQPSGPGLRRFGLGRLGLRARIAAAFALSGLLLSSIISLATLGLTRQNLLQERDSSTFAEFVNNARRVRNELTSETDDEGRRAIVERLGQTSGTFPLLRVGEAWTAADPLVFGRESVPDSLLRFADAGTPARMRATIGDSVVIVSVLPITSTGVKATYFEAALLDDIDDTLEALTVILLGAAAVTTVLAAFLGVFVARRLMRPLAEVSTAAEALAAGALDTRLDPPADTDLASLTASFNEMARALEDRIARDARFASAVSHELRSPLMTLTASVEVLSNSAEKLGDRGRIAIDLLADDIARLHRLVEDLLEINRYDVGIADLRAEPLDAVEFVQQAISVQGTRCEIDFQVTAEARGTVLWADKRRLGQVVSNLVDNAVKYGGGRVYVEIDRLGDRLLLSIEDDGAGVAADEREVIFERFSRGRAGGRRGRGSGSGLGLALVNEHVSVHGGRVWAEDRSGGLPGARFTVELPIAPNGVADDEASISAAGGAVP